MEWNLRSLLVIVASIWYSYLGHLIFLTRRLRGICEHGTLACLLMMMLTLVTRVEAFFAFHLHAVKLFHGPSFLASLDLAPTHPRFPPAGILHAICAIGSLYTASIAPTPHPTEWNTCKFGKT